MGTENAGQSTEFLNQANRPMPNGLQRFLAKKGINSSNDLFNRAAPRMPFRGERSKKERGNRSSVHKTLCFVFALDIAYVILIEPKPFCKYIPTSSFRQRS